MLRGLVVVGLVLLVEWIGVEHQNADAEVLSFSLRAPRSGIAEPGYFARRARKSISYYLARSGMSIRSKRSIRDGFHLVISMSVRELSEGTTHRCAVVLRSNVFVLPQNRFVTTMTAQGSGRMNNTPNFSTSKRRELRELALRYAAQQFGRGVRQQLRRVRATMRELPKGEKIGIARTQTKRRRASSGRKVARAARSANKSKGNRKTTKEKKVEKSPSTTGKVGKALNGRVPRLKWLPPQFVERGEQPT